VDFSKRRISLRFLAWSHELNLTNGICFLTLAMFWLRAFGIEGEVALQTDWGEEFGGSNPKKLERLQKKYFQSLEARLTKIPLGRKEHNGRVERSHHTDDEFLAKMQSEEGFLRKGAGWVYYYNLKRPHYGERMDGKPPFWKLRELGSDRPEEFALFPPLVLDRISADWALAWALRGGNDLLAHHSRGGSKEALPVAKRFRGPRRSSRC
jgi:hypothetical protein